MARSVAVKFSLTETPQFERLVSFVSEIREYAETNDDYELQSLVNHLGDDLIAMSHPEDDPCA